MDTEAHFVLGTSAVKTIAATEMLDLESLEKQKHGSKIIGNPALFMIAHLMM